MTLLAAILSVMWLTGTEGPSAVVDSPNLVGRVVESRFDGTNDYTTIYFTHDLDRAPSAAVCYCSNGSTNAVYGIWQGGWTNKVAIGGWGQSVPEDPYQASKWTDCRTLVTRRPVALRSAQARPDLRFAFGNADTCTSFALKGVEMTVNSNAVHIVNGILTKKGIGL